MFLGFAKQTEKQPKQIEFWFVSVGTEKKIWLFRGHPGHRFIFNLKGPCKFSSWYWCSGCCKKPCSISWSPEMPTESNNCKSDLEASQFSRLGQKSAGQPFHRRSYSSLIWKRHSFYITTTLPGIGIINSIFTTVSSILVTFSNQVSIHSRITIAPNPSDQQSPICSLTARVTKSNLLVIAKYCANFFKENC